MSLNDDQFMMRLDTCGRTISSVFTIYSSSLLSLLGFTLPPFVLVAAFGEIRSVKWGEEQV